MEILDIRTEQAPRAIGPYSQGIRAGGFIYVSGQTPLDPSSGVLVSGGIEAQTRQALLNVQAVLAATGATLGNVVKTTVFIRDMNDFPRINEIYAGFFSQPYPARSTVEVSRLPKDALIEIEAVAVMK